MPGLGLSQIPSPGTLKMITGAGPDTPEVQWLLSSAWKVQQTVDLRNGPWLSGAGPNSYLIGGALAWPLNTGLDPGPRYYRIEP